MRRISYEEIKSLLRPNWMYEVPLNKIKEHMEKKL